MINMVNSVCVRAHRAEDESEKNQQKDAIYSNSWQKNNHPN